MRSLLSAMTVLALAVGACSPEPGAPEPMTEALTSAPAVAPPALPDRVPAHIDDLAMPVEENRAASLTNQRSMYVYTRTYENDHPEHAWFAGANLAQRRVFSGYEVWLEDYPENSRLFDAVVASDHISRGYMNEFAERLTLFDHQDVLEIEVFNAFDDHQVGFVDLYPTGEGVERIERRDGRRSFYSSMEGDLVIGSGGQGNRAYLVVAETIDDADALIDAALEHADAWRQARRDRLNRLLNDHNYVSSSDEQLTAALRWIAITMDQLVTQQSGDGIYAGLPWFNEYWGRDSFIALPGALLVTGEFEMARNVLTSFAEYQDLDPGSEFYGRVPNIVKPDALDYHTTDGTPRFIVALDDYVRYSGDESLYEELWPNIEASIEGALANWVDERGYLTHAENETWMDARRQPDLAAYSPRDTRANDIQALWRDQLFVGVRVAYDLGHEDHVARWGAAMDRLTTSFREDFIDEERDYLADRLTAQDEPDFQLRPNQLFALDLARNTPVHARAVRTVWENLVFPWGVASLAPSDPNFHPYHLAWDRYHKDAAYHNGTVWLWLNGIAMQRMIEFGQQEEAWRLFETMNRFALERGVVGGLAENSDAYPHPGEDEPRLTGTYLQAWSNSEHLRVWKEYFLGVRPISGRGLTLSPRLPDAVQDVSFTSRIRTGHVHAAFRRDGEEQTWLYEFDGVAPIVFFDWGTTRFFEMIVEDGHVLEFRRDAEDVVHTRWFDETGALIQEGAVRPNPSYMQAQAEHDALFEGVDFARPLPLESHPVMEQTYDGGR
jgi:glycogen debranching enzyme